MMTCAVSPWGYLNLNGRKLLGMDDFTAAYLVWVPGAICHYTSDWDTDNWREICEQLICEAWESIYD